MIIYHLNNKAYFLPEEPNVHFLLLEPVLFLLIEIFEGVFSLGSISEDTLSLSINLISSSWI